MIINGKPYRTVWTEDGAVKTINQSLLPGSFEIVTLRDYREVIVAIRDMIVRGAPAIGAMGAYGLAMAINQMDDHDMDRIHTIKKELEQARPTANDLSHGLNYLFDNLQPANTIDEMKAAAAMAAQSYADRSVEACRLIGTIGNELIKDGDRILTHCNAGALATVDYGTALAVIRRAHYDRKSIYVYVDETRPRLQGLKITAWELLQEGIPHAIIADNAAGYFMQQGEIDIVITGADRVAVNGDAANKIGTYEKAVLAKENGIPFYIAAPLATIDFHCPSGDKIPIENRDAAEILMIDGKRIAPQGSQAKNPAFDVTPAKYIRGIITEKGIFKPGDIRVLEKNA
ncbi:MAG: S-methyl-5-thioribose-1-phosphate isomerase [Candidatus Neomarinimicrobiota bacterium]